MLEIVLTPTVLVPPEIGGPRLKPFYPNGKSAPVPSISYKHNADRCSSRQQHVLEVLERKKLALLFARIDQLTKLMQVHAGIFL